MAEIEATVYTTCPKCGHEYEETTTVEVEPQAWGDLD